MAGSDKQIQALPLKDKPYKHSLGEGLYLYIMPEGGKYWRLKYRFGGKEKTFSIGVFPDVSADKARKACQQAKALLRDGIGPMDARRQANKLKQKPISKNLFRFELSVVGGLTLETDTKIMTLTPVQTKALRSFLVATNEGGTQS